MLYSPNSTNIGDCIRGKFMGGTQTYSASRLGFGHGAETRSGNPTFRDNSFPDYGGKPWRCAEMAQEAACRCIAKGNVPDGKMLNVARHLTTSPVALTALRATKLGGVIHGVDPGDYTTPNVATLHPSLSAEWMFETGDNIQDSVNGAYLTWMSTQNPNPPVSESVFVEGISSINLQRAYSEYLYINDDELPDSFPLKNGNTNQYGAISFWLYSASQAGTNKYVLLKKGNFQIYIQQATFMVSIDGGATYNNPTAKTGNWVSMGFGTGKWLHVVLNIDWNFGQITLGVWDLSAASGAKWGLGWVFVTPTLTADPLIIGARGSVGAPTDCWDGYIDALRFWKTSLTAQEQILLANLWLHGPTPLTQDISKVGADSSTEGYYLLGETSPTVDSMGNVDLTQIGTPQQVNVPMAGGQKASHLCYDYAGSDFYYISEGNLPSSWPLKYQANNLQMTLCFWYTNRFWYIGDQGSGLFGHFYNLITNGGWVLHTPAGTQGTARELLVTYGAAGGTSTLFNTGIYLQDWMCYHIALRINNSVGSPSLDLRVFEVHTGNVYTYSTSPTPMILPSSNANQGVGDSRGDTPAAHGLLQQAIFFSRLLTDTEVDWVRQGKFCLPNTINLGTDCVAETSVGSIMVNVLRALHTACAATTSLGAKLLNIARALVCAPTAVTSAGSIMLNVLRDLCSPGVTVDNQGGSWSYLDMSWWWSVTVPNVPLIPGSVQVVFTRSVPVAGTWVITDDGAGYFRNPSNNEVIGWVDYATGEITFHFGSKPDSQYAQYRPLQPIITSLRDILVGLGGRAFRFLTQLFGTLKEFEATVTVENQELSMDFIGDPMYGVRTLPKFPVPGSVSVTWKWFEGGVEHSFTVVDDGEGNLVGDATNFGTIYYGDPSIEITRDYHYGLNPFTIYLSYQFKQTLNLSGLPTGSGIAPEGLPAGALWVDTTSYKVKVVPQI